eukprot:GFYU01007295.1.p1 GENE.GFYU01007295.1~~GFYU01007295.1.p1  ORF type:complete len:196 (-),score=30.28 GFYU01007295.1:78-665(-)
MCNLEKRIILDLEARRTQTPEIIELPSVFMVGNKVIDEFQQYVIPENGLDKVARDLTGITPAKLRKYGCSFSQALERYDEWITSHDALDAIVITVGEWDLHKMMPEQLSFADTPAYFRRWMNLKYEFQHFYNLRKNKGMAAMLKYLGLELEGRHHSGIDDCRNTVKILQTMLRDGYQLDPDEIRYLNDSDDSDSD